MFHVNILTMTCELNDKFIYQFQVQFASSAGKCIQGGHVKKVNCVNVLTKC